MQWITNILNAKYKKVNLDEIAANADHLTNSEQESQLKLLKKYEDLFDGTLGTFTGTPYDIKLKDNVEPHHARTFPVPKIHELTLKSELDCSCELNILKRVNRSEWGAPTFIVPKKDATVRFVSNFRELNKRIKRSKNLAQTSNTLKTHTTSLPTLYHIYQSTTTRRSSTSVNALAMTMTTYHLAPFHYGTRTSPKRNELIQLYF